ncbi:hypothetical protein CERZMDRAFT_31028 [Cercospora zeae-maydis SCOH1-5]|uniref:Uncharacterized protein n=1 Tax=Cercospora zeae-maydis SCOH1-5 TaxID=717836 RepID=A0A6A6FWF7_9PEZI|nr:hypothetical protein CERZMDRAFT_31028 [Cercospora zeae-maydis SCOH1-5]
MTLWHSYRNLSPKTRLVLGGAIMAWSAVGLFVSDRAEQAFGLVPTEQDKEKLHDSLPKIHFVEKG